MLYEEWESETARSPTSSSPTTSPLPASPPLVCQPDREPPARLTASALGAGEAHHLSVETLT